MAAKSVYYNRLHQLAIHEGLSDRALSLLCGLNENAINKIGKELSSSLVCAIYRIYPKINLYWLIFGIGEKIFIEDGDSTNIISNFFLDEYRQLQVENRQLIAENAVLKEKLAGSLRTYDNDYEHMQEGFISESPVCNKKLPTKTR